eukprot:TRINITY_DN1982_c0_g1_i1.p1 TRINITY_DN1982_c0_g1~~TRINITY_DN1982_c0_g1_i1.p1  ORF type:complete len:907 (-),score=260.18 TRINITY_DN1982_c0_g1_i1:49-2769(-)
MLQWRRFQFFDKEAVSQESIAALQKLVITCCTSGRGRLVFGDSEGFINIMERDFANLTSFQAYGQGAVHLAHQLKQSNILVTVGDEEEHISPTIKIWNMDKTDKGGNPLCLKVLKMKGVPTVPATCIAVDEDLRAIAVGLCNQQVVLFIGEILRDKIRQVVLQGEGANPVTALEFYRTHLFVTTSSSVVSYDLGARDLNKEDLDEFNGCGIGCAVLSDEGDLVMGKKEAIYFFTPESRGSCFAFEGEKKFLSWFRSYLIVVGQDPNNAKTNTMTIYDMKNRLIAYSESRFQNITHVVSEWGSIFILTADGKMFQFEEKDTQTKLETLFKKNLYLVAINLALSQNYDSASITDIFRRYGDHLYEKGDYDGAIGQYVKTIGNLEPSYIIRKFLDAQRIHNLTTYLQALHEKGLANADHTTLLFNCYTKLKDVKKLDQFIKTDAELNFEIETAIKACRSAGYFDHALYLAKRHHEHDSYLKILLEDLKGYHEALDYIATLDFFEAEKNLKKYGKILVTALPEQTTALLMRLCTDYVPVTNSNTIKQAPKVKAKADEFIHIFVAQPRWLTHFLEFIISQHGATNHIYNTLLELYLKDESVPTLVPNMDETPSEAKPQESQKTRLQKALELLADPQAKYDDDHALVLCKMHNFREGLLHLYDKLGLYHEILRYHMENNEYDHVIRACRKYGDKDSNMWIQVLTYFVGKSENCHKEITEVLGYIDRDNLIPPLIAVQILSQKSATPLSLIKDYITRRLQHENQLISEDGRQIKNFREETKKMRSEIQELKTTAKIFQLNKCSYCTSALDLPAIHFLCMHSFHQRCLGENEGECPQCAPQNKKILEIKRSAEENVDKHDLFFKQLEGSPDGFSTVAEYFGRGIFNRTTASGFEMLPLPDGKSQRELLFDVKSV